MPPLVWNGLKQLQQHHMRYNGLDRLDQKLESYLDFDNGFFVELGANDGVTQSNTLYFERYRNWTGVLVEPSPDNFLQCVANRATRTKTYCNACTSFAYTDKFVEIVYAGLMSVPVGLESDVADPAEHAGIGRENNQASYGQFSFGAVAVPLNKLLIEAQAPQLMDLLSLDVEGAEIDVLKGIDHAQFRFKFLCVESRSFDGLKDYLAANGYAFEAQLSRLDYLFRNTR